MSDITKQIAELSLEKRQLLERYLKKAGVNLSRAVITRRSREVNSFPLSFAQQRLWFMYQMEPDSPVYNLPDSHYFGGTLDVSLLERSLGEIVRRHESLRTIFQSVDGEPVQIVVPPAPVSLEVIDLGHLPAAVREAEAQRLADEEAQQPFDLSTLPPLRLRLLKLQADEHVLLVTMHHIVSDGWSMGVLMEELTALYAAFAAGERSPLEELEVQYADYAVWQREWLQGEALEEQLGYWREQLSGELPVLELPADRPRPFMFSFRGASQTFTLSSALTERLQSLSREASATLFMTLLAAFDVLLARYSGQEEIIVGTPIAGRNRAEIENLIGFFVNTLVLRTTIREQMSFRELLAQVRETTLGAYAHQDVPFEKLVEELQPERNLNRTPLFQVMFALQNVSAETQKPEGLKVERLDAETGTTKFELTLFAQETDDGLFCWFQYNTDLFDAATIKRMAGHFETLLSAIATNAEQHLADLPLLTAAERYHLLVEHNQTHTDYPRAACIQQLFEAQAARRPAAVALSLAGVEMSYGELNERANQLAHYLRAGGVAPDVPVAIGVERSFEMIVALLGVLKAGGAYVPLDASYPPSRLRFMLGDTGARLVLTQQRYEATLREAAAGTAAQEVVCLDAQSEALKGESVENPVCRASAEHLAYITYTSGSTGEPKGVEIAHRGVVRLIKETNYTTFDEGEVFLQYAPLSFDASTFEIWGALLNGGRLALMRAGLATAEELAGVIEAEGVTTLWLTTGLFHLLVDEQAEALRRVRRVLTGGEVLSVEHARRYMEGGEARGSLVNMYGPTENTTFSTGYELQSGMEWRGSVPIGRPVSNTEVYVLDRRQEPVVTGAIGELYAGGDGLARGYRNRAKLTAENFVPHPFSREAGARLYRTGDLVRYLGDGNIEFVGRADKQLKVRGFRIEPGEIEATLGSHSGVRECVVVARDEGQGDKRLVAYVVAQEEQQQQPAPDELRSYLRERLPEYMLPVAFVMLDSLPLTPQGKIDRRALPAPENRADVACDSFIAPQTPIEEILAAVWSEVLSVGEVGLEDNFFRLGGHSLLATRVVSRVRQTFQLELPLRALFEHSTLRQLAAEIETRLRAGRNMIAPPLVRLARRRAPLSFAQQRLWFIDQYEPGSSLYNIPIALSLSGPLDITALNASLSEIVRRHESLRTTFALEEDVPVQVVHDPRPVELPVSDLSQLPAKQRESSAEELIAGEAQRSFDLSAGPLLRGTVLRLAADEHILLITMHHIISDGWSLGVLGRELAALYEAYTEGRESSLEETPIQYADFAVWQREWLQGETLEAQLAYWRRQLAEAPAVLELPTDRPRPKQRSHRGAHHEFSPERQLVAELRELDRREGATLFMTLLAAWQVLLSRYSGQTDICVGVPVANRNRAETEGLIGFFVNTLVLRTDLTGEPSFRELLRRVRDTALGAYAHQDVPFEKLVEELQPERDLSHTPLFQVMLILQNAAEGEFELPGLRVGEAGAEDASAKFDLTLAMQEAPGELHARLTYNTDLFDAATIERMARHFETLLQSIVSHPDEKVSRLSLLTPEERRRLLVEWNRTESVGRAAHVLHQLFERQAARTPDATALVCEEERLTYGELNARANQLAHYLRARGAGPDSLVAVLLERSARLVVSLLAILKAGAAYVPLDPAYPQQRIAFMLDDANVSLLLCGQRFAGRVHEGRAQVICLDTEADAFARESAENPPHIAAPQNLAYVIYTSGSTGTPKGVAIEHRSVAAFLAWANATFPADVLASVLAATSVCFDLSVFELFAPLSTGGRIVLVENALHLRTSAAAREVTLVNTVPSAMAELVRSRSIPQTVRVVNLAGEPLTNQLAQSIYEQGQVERVFNLYGPSEDTTYSTFTSVERGAQSEPAIGRPVSGTSVYVLDEKMEVVPVGVTGELYIGGAGLARGYLNRPELTAERFVPDPYGVEAGARLYRTGDLVRYLPDGKLEFLGRLDQQVKVRGFRIEPGEIEARLREHEAVREAVVVAREDEAGEKRLVAYLVAMPEMKLSAVELRAHLQERLPDYMTPAAFVMLDALPLTPNGKVNRKALPAPERGAVEERARFVAPRSDLEKLLAGIWSEILGVPQVGIEDNFFGLGGHSLLATRVVSRLRERRGIELPLRVLFESPTVAGVAHYVESIEPPEDEVMRLSLILEKLENISEEEVRALLAETQSERKA